LGFKLEMKLLEGEQIVLDDGPLGFRKKLTLTNKRLIIQKGKGLFNVYWAQESEIPLEEIEEAYVEPGGVFFTMSTAMLKMKNQQSIELGLKLSDSQMLGSTLASDDLTDMNLRMKTVNDRWVNAINNQLNALRMKQLANGFHKCSVCGKSIPQGNFEFCPFCGKPLKT
jgi:rRNA maturation endonuclease Nob1